MKIVIINGSLRKNGATAKILGEFAKNLSEKPDVEVTNIYLTDLRLNFCQGCNQCYKNGVCHIKDDADMLSELISNADGVIIGTSNMVGNVTGQLKTFIDRGHFVIEQLLKDTYTIGVVTYENAEGGAALHVLKKLLVFSGAKGFDKLLVKLPFNSDPFMMQKVIPTIAKKSEKLYNSIQKKQSTPPITKIMQTIIFNIGIKPFVLKKGEAMSGVLTHWKKRGIIVRADSREMLETPQFRN